MPRTVYVSITGLKVRHFWQVPTFWRHAVASMSQAKSATGCLQAEARTIAGIHHTRSVWESEAAMRDYLTNGAHLKAMKLFHHIATGKTFGFATTDVPDWDEVHRLWSEKGRTV